MCLACRAMWSHQLNTLFSTLENKKLLLVRLQTCKGQRRQSVEGGRPHSQGLSQAKCKEIGGTGRGSRETPPWEGPLSNHQPFSCTRDAGREGHGHPVSLNSNPSARTRPEPQAGRAIQSPEGQHQESQCLRWTFPPLDSCHPCPLPFPAPST